jgi:hypothetical protein
MGEELCLPTSTEALGAARDAWKGGCNVLCEACMLKGGEDAEYF